MFPYTHFSFLQHRGMEPQLSTVPQSHIQSASPASVLVVEFRDEVFAAIHGDLASRKVPVSRAESAGDTVAAWRRHHPYLILINADMPDESGFLIALKLRLHGYPGDLWLYCASGVKSNDAFCDFCQISRVLVYGGDIRQLATHMQKLPFSRQEDA